jgi:hypothetical protein
MQEKARVVDLCSRLDISNASKYQQELKWSISITYSLLSLFYCSGLVPGKDSIQMMS